MNENEESVYPEGAVTGSAEDVLKDHEDVEIKNTNTETVSVKEEEPEQKEQQTEEKKEEQKEDDDKPADLQTTVDEQNKAAEDIKADLTNKGINCF